MLQPDYVYRARGLKSFVESIQWWIVPPRKRTTIHHGSALYSFHWPWLVFGSHKYFARYEPSVYLWGSHIPIISPHTPLLSLVFSNTGSGVVCMGSSRVEDGVSPEEAYFNSRFTYGHNAPRLVSLPPNHRRRDTIDAISRRHLGENAVLIGHIGFMLENFT